MSRARAFPVLQILTIMLLAAASAIAGDLELDLAGDQPLELVRAAT